MTSQMAPQMAIPTKKPIYLLARAEIDLGDLTGLYVLE
jgi:hypothetical protein